MKVLLLNPPGDRIYVRDYYCSKVSKANYIYEPPDLLFLSGILKPKYDVKVIDCIALNINEQECLNQITEYKPDAIIFLSGLVSYKQDFRLLDKAKSISNALMIGSGDIFMEESTKLIAENNFLDAILLDFTDPSILDYLDGKEKVRNIVLRKGDKIIEGEVIRGNGEEFKIPMPKHELFPLKKYKFPFVKKRLFATVLTDYGCPFKCNFCIMPSLGYKMRSIDSVIEELRNLRDMGITEIYFDDQTFAANRNRTIKLLNRMIAEKFNFGWCCFSRVDVVDEPLISKMKDAGCHTIMFGVESGNPKMLETYTKGITRDEVIETFKLCKTFGIQTLATFILGLPNETEETAEETIKFSLECGCDYASFNVAIPRMGTKLRKNAIKDNLMGTELYEMDQSGTKAILKTKSLTPQQVENLKNKAIRTFYFRPTYLARELFKIKSLQDLIAHIDGVIGVLKNMRLI